MSGNRKGYIAKISGPVIIGKGINDIKLGEVVYVGNEGLLGEVVRVAQDYFAAQVYEDTSGLRPREPVVGTGKLLVAELGPGLMSSVYDGVQRPLESIRELVGPFVKRGVKVNPLPREKKWHFVPRVERGIKVSPGDIIGTVQETPLIEHRIMVPIGVEGRLREIAPEGDYTVEDTIAVVEADGRTYELTMKQEWPVRQARPYKERLTSEVPLLVGQRVIDTFFPIAKGGAGAIPGGFGTGKTVTLHKVSMYSDSQIVIYIGCGERGNEIAEMLMEFPRLVDPKSGRPIIERSIVIANTSNMPVSAREASIYMGITLAEYYRDQGYDVTLIADSTSRWAEALREIAGRLGELPVERGYPAYLPDKIAEFYERGGRVKALGSPERSGSVTVLGAVSPPGGDYNEPVTIHTLRFVGVMWALDTDLAYRRHFPAINWLKSFSQYADIVERWWVKNVSPEFPQYRRRALRLMTVASEIEAIASVVGEGALPDDQRLILLTSEIIKEGFLRQTALSGEDVFCKPEKQYWLLKMMIDFFDKAYELIKKRVSIEEITRLPEVYEMMRVKEDERGLEAVKELYNRMMARLDEVAQRHGVQIQSGVVASV
ncbi:V-type ATP synthase subunit A [Infirmifilum lucidum]|uniref:A-type ATP synthase subunit A n=1 Tax=Infirmifilum lucidum TaxID=2776706 RepID=A0A7L9FEY2_9CREN|nr:V-type ATP synthase subunit A [Infirmifilum lucidum]QOJ78289.1 V-type ATP synthase subunit A [Infirmifilum lucidum]